MPPKKNNKRTRSKRHSCGLCAAIDNATMVECDDCLARYHMKCLGLETIGRNDHWSCLNCEEEEPQRNKQSANKSVILPAQKENISKPSEADNHARNHDDVQESRSQEHVSKQSSRHSIGTRSSGMRRTQLELERIEEERQLQAERDKKYLDSKYRVLMEECSERGGSEKRSTDRSSFTKEWVASQYAGNSKQIQVPPMKHQPKEPTSEEIVKRELEKRKLEKRELEKQDADNEEWQRTELKKNLDIIGSFARTIDNFSLSAKDKRSVPEPKPNSSTMDNQNKSRIPCQAHDAKSSINRGIFVQERSSDIPCCSKTASQPRTFPGMLSGNQIHDGYQMNPKSNSTFAATQTADENTSKTQENDQRTRSMSPNSRNYENLEWDSYMGAGLEKHQDFHPDNDETVKYSIGEGHNRAKTPGQTKNSMKSNVMEPLFMDQSYDDDTYTINEDQFTSTRRPINQSQRKVGFEESKYSNPNRSNVLSKESQLGTSYTPTVAGNITSEQIASRHVVEKRLPFFSGDSTEWPIWYNQYQTSTELCGFNHGENLGRLEKCLRDPARSKVKGHLTNPNSVPRIIDTLKMLYGRPEVIIKAIIRKIRDYPALKPDNLDDLMDFAFEVQTICTTIESLNCTNHLTDPMLLEDLVDKLPNQEKKDWARHKIGNRNVTIKTLADWLYELAQLLSTVATPKATKSKDRNERKPEKEKVDINEKVVGLAKVNFHGSQSNGRATYQQKGKRTETNHLKGFPCPVCKNECSRVENCSKFKSFDVDARWKAVNEFHLCRRCLQKRHITQCQATNICGKNGCQYKHHSLLHNDERYKTKSNNPVVNATVASSNIHEIAGYSTLLRLVPVILYNGNKSVATFAFFDDGTTVTMMEKRIANELGLNGTSEQICLIWTKKIHRKEKAERVSLDISGIDGFNKRYKLKDVRTVDDLQLPIQSMKKGELVARYPYLKKVPLTDYINAIPGIMIGSDMPKFGTQLEVIEPEDIDNYEANGPIASRTRLGWSVHGPRNGSTNIERVNVHQYEICPYHNELDNEIHQRVKEYFSVENFGVQANSKMNLLSKDNERALEMLNQLTKKVEGRYETGLLWKSDNITLPDSYPMALKRLVRGNGGSKFYLEWKR